eukprot:365942-Chlamydomonas_euryale.AAC.84
MSALGQRSIKHESAHASGTSLNTRGSQLCGTATELAWYHKPCLYLAQRVRPCPDSPLKYTLLGVSSPRSPTWPSYWQAFEGQQTAWCPSKGYASRDGLC